MYTFVDQHGCQVKLSFLDESFSNNAGHVWVICLFEQQWLLTKHLIRGLEFPGGKVEEKEMPIEAAKREILEETGGVISSIMYVGQYKVKCGHTPFYKNIYFARIKELIPRDSYSETAGPVLLDEFPENIRDDKRFSFMMRDDVLSHCIDFLKKKQLL